MATWKEKYNKKYGFEKDKAHSLSDISKKTGVSKKGIQQIYNKGIGAYKTNPQSVRPNVTSKEQWAMARVYSAVSGGKASKVDAKELKMEMGGKVYSKGDVISGKKLKQYVEKSDYGDDLSFLDYIEDKDYYVLENIDVNVQIQKDGTLRDYINSIVELEPNENEVRWINKPPIIVGDSDYERGVVLDGYHRIRQAKSNREKTISAFIKTLKYEKGGQIENFDRVGFYKDYYQRVSPSNFIVERDDSTIVIDMDKEEKFESGGKTEYDYGSYTTFDEEKIRNETEGVQYILNGEYILVARSLYMQDKELFNYYKYLQRLNITLEDCNKFALSLNNVFTDMVCNIKVIQKTDGNRSFASYKVRDYNNLESNSSYWGVENIDGVKKMINTSTDMVCCKGTFLERLSRKPIPAVDLKNYYSFQTLIHELAHCLDFQFQFKQGKLPVVAHKEYFLNALYKIIEACKNGTLPLAKNFGVRARGLKKASQLLNGKI